MKSLRLPVHFYSSTVSLCTITVMLEIYFEHLFDIINLHIVERLWNWILFTTIHTDMQIIINRIIFWENLTSYLIWSFSNEVRKKIILLFNILIISSVILRNNIKLQNYWHEYKSYYTYRKKGMFISLLFRRYAFNFQISDYFIKKTRVCIW